VKKRAHFFIRSEKKKRDTTKPTNVIRVLVQTAGDVNMAISILFS